MPRRRAVSHGSKLPIRHKGARVGASRLSVHRPCGGVSVHLHVPPPTASARARGARAGKDCAIEVGRARALPARACAMRYANQAMRPRRGTNSLRTRSAARARGGACRSRLPFVARLVPFRLGCRPPTGWRCTDAGSRAPCRNAMRRRVPPASPNGICPRIWGNVRSELAGESVLAHAICLFHTCLSTSAEIFRPTIGA